MRGSVEWFADEMEKKLRRNDEKKGPEGWRDMSPLSLYSSLMQEIRELKMALNEGVSESIIGECVDVANFAMMIADNVQKKMEAQL
jgi:NTP pyrophosphatase (non-canonical NTP hydrolase)